MEINTERSAILGEVVEVVFTRQPTKMAIIFS